MSTRTFLLRQPSVIDEQDDDDRPYEDARDEPTPREGSLAGGPLPQHLDGVGVDSATATGPRDRDSDSEMVKGEVDEADNEEDDDKDEVEDDEDLDGGVDGNRPRNHELHEADEVAFLRVENALLRKKVKELERHLRGEKRPMRLVVDESEMMRIDHLLKKAEDAKVEALNYVANTSRDKLGQDVKVLQSILKKAKAERQGFKKKIKAAEDRLRLERQKIEKEEIRFQVDREIFAKILKDDRDAYKHEVTILVQKMTDLQKEKHELYLWAKEQQERHLQEIRKLTRALGRTKRLVEDQRLKSSELLDDVVARAREAVAAPPAPVVPLAAASTLRVATPSA